MNLARSHARKALQIMGLREAIMTARAIWWDVYSPEQRLAAIAAIAKAHKLPRHQAQAFVDRFYKY